MTFSDFAALPETELARLDTLLARSDEKWPSFYANRRRPCPFFVDAPDEKLVGWIASDRLAPGRAVDLGCGNGRNALHLARQGFAVHAVDYSESAVAWARESVAASGLSVTVEQSPVFDFVFAAESADLLLPPHRAA